VPTTKPGSRPKLGVGRTEWSHDGRFIATVDEKSPTAVWIWDAVDSGLAAVLLQMGDVTGVSWDPRGDRLAVVTGGERVYVWTPEGASFVQIPLPDFNAKDVAWSPTGGEMVLSDDKTFCCSFMQ
jgi:WD40 repeat protein